MDNNQSLILTISIGWFFIAQLGLFFWYRSEVRSDFKTFIAKLDEKIKRIESTMK